MSRSATAPGKQLSSLLRDNGLLLACLGLFAVFFVGMIFAGAATYNQEQLEHGSLEQISALRYLTTGDFVEATIENWESEFLQMGMYVVLTAFLYQKGSSESKPVGKPAPQDEDPRDVIPTRGTRGRCAGAVGFSSYTSTSRRAPHPPRRRRLRMPRSGDRQRRRVHAPDMAPHPTRR